MKNAVNGIEFEFDSARMAREYYEEMFNYKAE